MKQFDVCWASGAGVAGRTRLVVVLQHHDIDAIATIVVAPLYLPSELDTLERLRPSTTIGGRTYLVAVDRLASIPKRQLGLTSDNLEHLRYEFTKALDLIFSGF
jgi:hypothetical protein